MLLSKAELKQKLDQPLPGAESQIKMAPAQRVEEITLFKDKIPFAKQSAVLILLFPGNEHMNIVFIRRSVYNGVHSGQIAFPGGQREEIDDTFEDTALRETFEEIGVAKDKIEILGQLTDIFIPPSNFLVKVFVAYTPERPVYVVDGREVQSVIEIELRDLYNESIIFEKQFSAKSYDFNLTAPFYKINGAEIWGATAMIVSELLDVLKPEN